MCIRDRYWQVPLAPESRKYTAFLFNGKNYQFKRLPFGLNTSVASFIKCLDMILQPKDLDFFNCIRLSLIHI